VRRTAINAPRRSAAKTYVAKALSTAATAEPEATTTALLEALSALDRAAKAGAIHPNAAARRKSRLTVKVNAALGGTTVATGGRVTKQTGKAAAAKAAKARIAAGKSTKAKGAQTAAGKARAALSKTARAEAAAARDADVSTEAAPAKPARPATKASAAKPATSKARSTATKAKATKPTARKTTKSYGPRRPVPRAFDAPVKPGRRRLRRGIVATPGSSPTHRRPLASDEPCRTARPHPDRRRS